MEPSELGLRDLFHKSERLFDHVVEGEVVDLLGHTADLKYTPCLHDDNNHSHIQHLAIFGVPSLAGSLRQHQWGSMDMVLPLRPTWLPLDIHQPSAESMFLLDAMARCRLYFHLWTSNVQCTVFNAVFVQFEWNHSNFHRQSTGPETTAAIRQSLDWKSIPPSLGKLNKLTRLYLNSNRLTGSIPHTLGNLSQLVVLDLDTNLLTGSIPSSLGNLTQLVLLDFNTNLLTGTLPPSME